MLTWPRAGPCGMFQRRRHAEFGQNRDKGLLRTRQRGFHNPRLQPDDGIRMGDSQRRFARSEARFAEIYRPRHRACGRGRHRGNSVYRRKSRFRKSVAGIQASLGDRQARRRDRRI